MDSDTYKKLINASSEGNIEEVKKIVKGRDRSGGYDDALMNACYYGHFEIIKHILECGGNIHVYDDYIITIACDSDRLDIVKFLVQNGADLYARSGAPLRCACASGNLQVVKYLVQECRVDVNYDVSIWDSRAILWASTLQILKFLIANGATVDDRTLRSAYGQNFEIIDCLVRHGANRKLISNGRCLSYLDTQDKIRDKIQGKIKHRKAIKIQRWWRNSKMNF